MSKWDNIKKELGIIADKTVTKTRELTDTASTKIKIANKEADRDIDYKKLGKLMYTKLKKIKVADPEALTAQISEVMTKLDRLNHEIATLKAEEATRRADKEAEKLAREAARKEEERREEEEAQIVMREFHEARKEAESEYRRAKDTAEELK